MKRKNGGSCSTSQVTANHVLHCSDLARSNKTKPMWLTSRWKGGLKKMQAFRRRNNRVCAQRLSAVRTPYAGTRVSPSTHELETRCAHQGWQGVRRCAPERQTDEEREYSISASVAPCEVTRHNEVLVEALIKEKASMDLVMTCKLVLALEMMYFLQPDS
ncbi:hypothetical protein F7725_012953 [Dissostichus mawsoni]|uniref:Uncharacterized protein n=1 Tax=Dissostichus mawsoni TaxID=36200 RepID=A0A7J5YQF7_DISMA|nr:hypothetical protein F7725_012953 [Dissostichus mawsoni]